MQPMHVVLLPCPMHCCVCVWSSSGPHATPAVCQRLPANKLNAATDVTQVGRRDVLPCHAQELSCQPSILLTDARWRRPPLFHAPRCSMPGNVL